MSQLFINRTSSVFLKSFTLFCLSPVCVHENIAVQHSQNMYIAHLCFFYLMNVDRLIFAAS